MNASLVEKERELTSIQFRLQSLHPTRRPTEPIDTHRVHSMQLDRLAALVENPRHFDSISHHLISEVDAERRSSGWRRMRVARLIRWGDCSSYWHLLVACQLDFDGQFGIKGPTKTSSEGPSRRGPR